MGLTASTGPEHPGAQPGDAPPTSFAPPAGAGYSPSEPRGAAPQRTSKKAVASLVIGILSLIVAGIILGVIAIVLGISARSDVGREPGLTGGGMALAGIILGAIGFVLAIVILIALGPTVVPGG